MKRKHNRLLKKGNMVVFPGTIERLLTQAEDALQAEEFEEAVRTCEQLLSVAPDTPELPGLLAVALYELKEFEKAKPFAAQWVQSDVADYFEAMELYLAICIQLQSYEEVEDTIGALLDEGVIPPDTVQKFIYLRDLNGRLANRFTEELSLSESKKMTLSSFMLLPLNEQQQFLNQLERDGADQMQPFLEELVITDKLPLLLRTAALVLLKQSGFSKTITVNKFGKKVSVVPANIALPGQDEETGMVIKGIRQELDKDPTRCTLIEEAVKKFAVLCYPLRWGMPPESVIDAYIDYSSFLFEGEPLPTSELHQFIITVDQHTGETAE